jgi:glycerophosphoryl diester phosphodiesterase
MNKEHFILPRATLLGFLALVSCLAAEPRIPGVIAHRGVVLEAPENTLPALQRAIDLGCAMAEIDLRYTSDGEVILLHDATLERTTNGSGLASNHTLAQIQKLDAGSSFGAAFAGTKVPTFREAIGLARGKIELYLDLKEFDPMPVAKVVQLTGTHAIVVFRPYTFLALKQITGTDPRFRVLVDLGDWVQAPGLMQMLRREFPTVSLSSDWRNWNQKMFKEARKVKLATFVNILGEDDTDENLTRALEMGFDYIQTDRQQRLKELIQLRRQK